MLAATVMGAFFCNSGAEANEAALRCARKATGKPGVIALEGGFHGRTLGALSATGQPAKREPFEPPPAGVRFARPNDSASLADAAGDDVGLIPLEPVLGEGGVIPLGEESVGFAAALARGVGLLVGAELDRPAQPVVEAALDAGLICLTSGANVLCLTPPLVVEPEHVDQALGILGEVLA